MSRTTGPVCTRCGLQGPHSCSLDPVITSQGIKGQGIVSGYLDTREGVTVGQWALMLDCAAEGCGEPHRDAHRMYPLMQFEATPAFLRGPTINGHKARILHRVVELPPWQSWS